MNPQTLKAQLTFSQIVLHRNLDGLSHEDSLHHPQPDVSCLNWVLGHIVSARNTMLKLFGREPLIPDAQLQIYRPRATPPLDPSQAIQLSQLATWFDQLQDELVASLKSVSDEHLAQPAPFSPTSNPKETIGSLLANLVAHEAYHSGQIGLLRRLAGKPGAIAGPPA